MHYRGLSLRGRRFPRALRNKWLAINSLLFLFFLYKWLNQSVAQFSFNSLADYGLLCGVVCRTQLFAPQMRSNMDCMLCLDCLRACPHDNVALMVRVPARELMEANAWSKRWDLSFLVIGLAFLDINNAFGMCHRFMR